jgi:hypothetical protein
MKLRKILLCGVAATALGLAAALPNSSILPNLANPAEAAVQARVSIGFGTFYSSLAPHGDWVRLEGRYVWIPTQVEAGWRPYTVGRWAYTRPHGWMWVSDEPYGWAVYHYGRWGYHWTIGWYWVPDTVWAPAWVTWRTSGDHIVWAPMPPRGRVGISFEVDPFAVPARYWVAVPTAHFLAPNIFSVALHFGEPRFYDVVRYTRPIGHVSIVNNIAVNTVINVNYIEQQTGETVRVREVREVNEPRTAQVDDDAIAVFAPAVQEEPEAEPPLVRTEEEVAERRGVDIAAAPPEEPEDAPVEVAEDAPPAPAEMVVEDPAPVTEEEVAEEPTPPEEPEVVEEPTPPEEPEVVEEPTPPEEPEVVEEPTPPDEPEVVEEPTPPEEPEVVEEPTPPEEPEVVEEPTPPEEPEVVEEPTPEAPAVVEEPTPEAPAVAEEPTPQVEERAIGEPAAEETEEERRRRLQE